MLDDHCCAPGGTVAGTSPVAVAVYNAVAVANIHIRPYSLVSRTQVMAGPQFFVENCNENKKNHFELIKINRILFQYICKDTSADNVDEAVEKQ